MLKEGLIENVCSICGITEWNNNPINMELDHIDGNRSNHKLENLRMLCPNCHSQTETYRSKNIKN
jgi:5-methylcytosine-specific restriction endonuclease McrA